MTGLPAMPILVQGLPTTVTVCGQEIPINTDFRYGITAAVLLADKNIPDGVAAETFLQLFCPTLFPLSPDFVEQVDIGVLLTEISCFYQMGDGSNFFDYRKTDSSILDFVADEARLVASFRQAYGMDLYTAELHWWQFLQLLTGLPGDTVLMEAIRLRVMDPVQLGDEGRYLVRLAKRAVRLD